MRLWALSAVLILAGCRHQPLTWRLTGEGGSTVLIPPKPPPIKIKNAREKASPGCDINQQVVSLAWRGKNAMIRVAPPASMVDAQGQPFASTMQGFQTFRTALNATAARGCLQADDSERLIRSAAEHAPLSPRAVFGLRYGGYAETGFIDLTPEFHLEVISPDGGTFEIAQYEIQPVSGGGVRLMLAGVNEGRARSISQDWLKFPESTRYLRLIFLIARSAADHEAMLVGAGSREALVRATAAVQSRPGQDCGVAQDYTCVPVPQKTAVNPQFKVRANGQDAFIALSGALRELARPRMQIPLATLRVKRMFEGRPIPVEFDANSSAILNLVLLPGDEIAW